MDSIIATVVMPSEAATPSAMSQSLDGMYGT
ncbi:hypothetical protein KIPB_017201, partial [Kipferlia bialata]|eukprot:g17201.t1